MRSPLLVGTLAAAFVISSTKPTPAAEPPIPPAVLPVPAEYAPPDRGKLDDPGLRSFCGKQSAPLPVRARSGAKATEDALEATHERRAKLLEHTAAAILEGAPGRTTREDLGDLLYTVGQRHMEDNHFAVALSYWDCAATRYADTKSMLKLAKLAFHGAKALDAPVPGLGEPNFAMSYFWVVSALYLDMCDGGRDNLVANGLGLMDELQNVPKYVTVHKVDHRKIEAEAGAFIDAVAPVCTERLRTKGLPGK